MERPHPIEAERRGSGGWLPLLLCWGLCAGTAGCAYDHTPPCRAQVAFIMPDSTPEPDRWVTEFFCMQSNIERIEREEPATYTMKDYRITLNTANQRDVIIPAWRMRPKVVLRVHPVHCRMTRHRKKGPVSQRPSQMTPRLQPSVLPHGAPAVRAMSCLSCQRRMTTCR